MKYRYFLLILFFIISGCEKNGNSLRVCYNKKYEPNISIEQFSSYSIDFDDDEMDDVIFNSNLIQFGISAKTSSDDIEISKGVKPFSGSYHTIKFNDIIDEHLYWYQTLPLTGTINNNYYGEHIDYLGIKKKTDGGQSYYGWLKFVTTDSTFKLMESFYLKCSDCTVQAGIINDTCNVR